MFREGMNFTFAIPLVLKTLYWVTILGKKNLNKVKEKKHRNTDGFIKKNIKMGGKEHQWDTFLVLLVVSLFLFFLVFFRLIVVSLDCSALVLSAWRTATSTARRRDSWAGLAASALALRRRKRQRVWRVIRVLVWLRPHTLLFCRRGVRFFRVWSNHVGAKLRVPALSHNAQLLLKALVLQFQSFCDNLDLPNGSLDFKEKNKYKKKPSPFLCFDFRSSRRNRTGAVRR
jgi:hypothetical protein